MGGQRSGNTAGLPEDPVLRAVGAVGSQEAYELGDLRADDGARTIIVEYDGEGPSLINLAKYWPYVRGELSATPSLPIALCHFSSWASYGSHRLLWQWLLARMREDQSRVVDFQAQQFDHARDDSVRRRDQIQNALQWLRSLEMRT
jgi:hypothetical protein